MIDIYAGITCSLIAVPQSLAFAVIAGLPIEYGLYTCIVPTIIAALFGSSFQLVTGSTFVISSAIYISLGSIEVSSIDQYISLVISTTFLVGIMQLIAGISGVGRLFDLVSSTVVVGISASVAVTIIFSESQAMLGIGTGYNLNLSNDENSLMLFAKLHLFDVLIVFITLLSGIIAIRKLREWSLLIAIGTGCIAASLFNYTNGIESSNIQIIGSISGILPPISINKISFENITQLIPTAISVATLALVQTSIVGRTISTKSGQRVSGDQEFIGQGLSNIFGSFFSSYVATGSFIRSTANYNSGAFSPLAAIVSGVFLLIFIFFFSTVGSLIPQAVILGIMVLIAWQLVNYQEILEMLKADRMEAALFGIVFFSALFSSIPFALFIGVLFSTLYYLERTFRPKLLPKIPYSESASREFTTASSLPECPQLKILRLDGSLYFGSVNHVEELLGLYRVHYPEQKHLLLLTQGISQVDYGGAKLLVREALKRREYGGDLYMYRLRDAASKVFYRGDYVEVIGEKNIFYHKSEAISSIFDRLDKDICSNCENRVFIECQSIRPNVVSSDDHDSPHVS